MAWQTPVTDWTESDVFTYDDANRISANLNYLNTNISLSTNFSTTNAFLPKSWFTSVASAINYMLKSLGMTGSISKELKPVASTFYMIEYYTLAIKTRLDLIAAQKSATIYCGGFNMYASDTIGIYARGVQ